MCPKFCEILSMQRGSNNSPLQRNKLINITCPDSACLRRFRFWSGAQPRQFPSPIHLPCLRYGRRPHLAGCSSTACRLRKHGHSVVVQPPFSHHRSTPHCPPSLLRPLMPRGTLPPSPTPSATSSFPRERSGPPRRSSVATARPRSPRCVRAHTQAGNTTRACEP